MEANRGGIIAFCKQDIKNIVLWKVSPDAERAWHIVQRDSGSVAICNWYRPPHNETESINSFRQELQEIYQSAETVVVAGDLNIHHVRWLKHSSGNTPQGNLLWDCVQEFGLRQIVKEPTRNNYLLDLVLTHHDKVKVSVHGALADHKSLLIEVPDAVERKIFKPRTVFHYSHANWPEMERILGNKSWQSLYEGSVDDAVAIFYDNLSNLISRYVPCSVKAQSKSNLPWLNDACANAIHAKHAAEGTEAYHESARICRHVLHDEQKKYHENLRKRLESLPRNSKQWWTITNQLLRRNCGSHFFPLHPRHGRTLAEGA